MVLLCKRISKSFVFRSAVVLAILFASALVGIETYPGIFERHKDLLLGLDKAVLLFFSFEIAVKLIARGRRPSLYFYDPWNVFDFTIVLVCFLPLHFEYLAAARLLRILRVLRLVTVIPRMQVLVGALLKSLPSISYVSLLLGVLFYVYAVVGTLMFGRNDPIHFGTLAIAMVSLFRVVTLEDWTDIMYIQMYGSDKYAAESYVGLDAVAATMPLFSVLYFVSFVLLGTMIVLNLFVGVILTGMQELQAEADLDRIIEHQKAKRLSIADEMQLLSSQLDTLQESVNAVHRRIRNDANAYRGVSDVSNLKCFEAAVASNPGVL